jgi:nucleotidyltransferase AbiEii toxin of type IV toxin-antitoxin system
MDNSRLRDWEPLFVHALKIIDAAEAIIGPFSWSFGGGTVLMLRYQHRYSRDIDIFLRDPQFIGHMTPRLSPIAEAVSDDYDEQGEFVKLRLPGGEIDFIGTGWLTPDPYHAESLMGRSVNLETPAEIIAKKVLYRAASFKARDLFDLAVVLDNEPDAIREIAPVIREHRALLETRVQKYRAVLREEYEGLDFLDNGKTFDDCIAALARALKL